MATSPINVLNPATGPSCAGDSNYVDGSGTDDATAFQAQLNAAVQAGGVPQVDVPANRTYRIGTTITVPSGVTIRGVGGRNNQGTSQPATFVWTGSADGVMFDVAVDAQNIPMTCFENICWTGRTDGVNNPATLVRFRGINGALGAVDTGSYFRNCWFEQCTGNAVSIEGGATNVLFEHGRWDNWGGYAMYVAGGGANITIDGNATMAMGAAANGFMFFDGEVSGATFTKAYGLHLETNASANETYSGGASPFDRRGLIRFGVNSTVTSVQHHFYASGLQLDEPFSIASHGLFQITASTTTDSNLDNSRMVSITVDEGKGLARGTTDTNASDETRIICGRVHATERPPVFGTGNFGHFHFGVGKNTTGEQIVSWTNSRGTYIRGPVLEARTVAQLPTDFPKEGQLWYANDLSTTTLGATAAGGGSNKGYVGYNGTNYKIVSIIN